MLQTNIEPDIRCEWRRFFKDMFFFTVQDEDGFEKEYRDLCQRMRPLLGFYYTLLCDGQRCSRVSVARAEMQQSVRSPGRDAAKCP